MWVSSFDFDCMSSESSCFRLNSLLWPDNRRAILKLRPENLAGTDERTGGRRLKCRWTSRDRPTDLSLSSVWWEVRRLFCGPFVSRKISSTCLGIPLSPVLLVMKVNFTEILSACIAYKMKWGYFVSFWQLHRRHWVNIGRTKGCLSLSAL